MSSISLQSSSIVAARRQGVCSVVAIVDLGKDGRAVKRQFGAFWVVMTRSMSRACLAPSPPLHSAALARSTRQNRTEQNRTGQNRAGQDRTGQDRAGQDRSGQVRTEQNRAEERGERNSTEQNRAERNEQNMTEQKAR